MSDDSDTDDELAQALEGVITAAAPALSGDELETLGEAVDRLREDDGGDDIPKELASYLNWAEITIAPNEVDGDYIAAWDDSHHLQARSLTLPDAFENRYVTWGTETEYEDSHVELIVGETDD